MKKRTKRYNGEEESYVEDYSSLGKRAAAKERDEDYAYDPISKVTGEAEMSRAKQLDKEESPKTFKQAFAAARSGGDKTFMWRGKKYTTELAKPKVEKESKTERREEVSEPVSKPAKTSKEEMPDIVSRTPLRNPQGGINIQNALRRSQEVGASAMKESGRQARVDRIRRNVGSNLETYGMKSGGKVSASKRADGAAIRGKTRGRIC